ncbi:hypoxanthine phosphoribosyltransferase [Agaricicola taiwanensis]|uniref:Hypoxanthine phosphoribosyltransferase n=1 Tax=Agaricicola taiwanensis TaxID=591372 RepID=A0A8J2YM02_9RHOB|nr:hypoxanthine phosphoribosyltransferase [Agaricicola taiwanensis]GGE51133.1 hypoxanthine phosphoribosyltransferase [Agaricicola taiwanensis]
MSIHVKTLISAEEIAARNAELARTIAATVSPNVLVIAILKGSFVFAADLIRAFHDARMEPQVEFLQLSSYRDATISSGQVDVIRDIESDVAGREVLLIDDILESGRTLAYAKDLLAARGASKVYSCVLLDKQNKRSVTINADFVGFVCPDYFVVGYGMDVAHAWRQLPFVGIVERDGDSD